MEIINYIFSIISFWYLINIIWLLFGFNKLKSFESDSFQPKTKFTVVVPFRNEAENLPMLLESISALNYPKNLFEVILVDDYSDFKFQISNFKFQISVIDNIRTSNSPKKDAIKTAINLAQHDWIITTDADCLLPENWLATFDAFIQKNNPKMIAAGVSYQENTSFFDAFQSLDFLSLQGTTMASFGNKQAFMCNGANFCYQKNFFKTLNGFQGNENIASGDDVFLLQKALVKNQKDVYFLQSIDAVVQTKTEKSWKALFNQRVRWASKTANYSDFYSKQLSFSVLLMNLCFAFWILSFGFQIFGLLHLGFLALKIILDYILISKTAQFFKTKMHYFLVSSFVYPFFCATVGLYSVFGSYSWKGRRF